MIVIAVLLFVAQIERSGMLYYALETESLSFYNAMCNLYKHSITGEAGDANCIPIARILNMSMNAECLIHLSTRG